MRSQERDKLASFEQSVLPHLGAAYNLARWLTRNEHDAEDVVQEAYMRAFKFFAGFRGGNSRSWLLTIVRNTCYTWMHQNRSRELTTDLDEEVHALDSEVLDPEALLLEKVSSEVLKRALDELPIEFREAVVLRELEEMSYKEIADISGVPLGTVMSRLARGRKRLQQLLTGGKGKKASASLLQQALTTGKAGKSLRGQGA
jgi:RNA polymerase sigma factor (sigma-70 family)